MKPGLKCFDFSKVDLHSRSKIGETGSVFPVVYGNASSCC